MAELLKIFPENPNPKAVDKVVEVLKKGGLIIYPTDTVYGLGCDINNHKALERIARLKGIKLERTNFSFICQDLSNLSDYIIQIDTPTFKLLKRNLPGPYTFVLPGAGKLPHPFKKKKTVGIRVPNNSIALEIVKRLGNPIVSTSIRDEDTVLEYTTDPELIFEKWQSKVDLVIDGGYGDNQASTVVQIINSEVRVLREGKGTIDTL
jgi:tRNA threonylcarbamoyl adenosine modification protein (Sua5/YciO/YrdC/YwlC family)